VHANNVTASSTKIKEVLNTEIGENHNTISLKTNISKWSSYFKCSNGKTWSKTYRHNTRCFRNN